MSKLLIPLSLQFFSEGEPETTLPVAEKLDQAPPVPPAKPVGKTYTEEDYQQAVSAQFSAGIGATAKMLGIDTKGKTIDEIKVAIKEAAEERNTLKLEKMTESERIATQLEQAKQAKAEAEQMAEAQLTAIAAENAQKVQGLELKIACLSLGVNPDSADDVALLANKDIGAGKSVQEAVGAVLLKYPQFKKQETQTPPPAEITPPPTPPAPIHSGKPITTGPTEREQEIQAAMMKMKGNRNAR